MSETPAYNENKNRYELDVEGHIVYADVRRQDRTLYIDYVYAPPELRGTGAAGRFMEGLMNALKQKNLKAVPICGYAAAWMKRHSR